MSAPTPLSVRRSQTVECKSVPLWQAYRKDTVSCTVGPIREISMCAIRDVRTVSMMGTLGRWRRGLMACTYAVLHGYCGRDQRKRVDDRKDLARYASVPRRRSCQYVC